MMAMVSMMETIMEVGWVNNYSNNLLAKELNKQIKKLFQNSCPFR